MKKIVLFLALLLCVSMVWGATIFEEDFETVTAYSPISLTDWTNQNVVGNELWEGREFSSNLYAQMSSFESGEVNEVWLVTPAIDLSGYTDTEFVFDIKVGYWNYECLTVHISTDFVDDVTTASWDDVTSNFTIPTEPSGGYGSFASAGTMDLTSYSGSIYIAFKYVGDDNAGETTTYQVDNVVVSGTGSTPEVTVSTSTLSGFSYTEGEGPSGEQIFDVAGTNLVGDVVVTAPTNYEISETSGSGFTSTISLTPSSGTLAETSIYVRLKAGLAIGSYNEDVIVSSTDATDKTVSCSGSVNSASLPNAWINELHYDNSGADENEGVEVVIENPGDYTLDDFFITLYNGSDSAADDTHTLDTFIEGSSEGDFTIYYMMIPGIQNGAPDGLALGYISSLIQFLSYEGTFTAVDGIANGVLSTDIGVSEGITTTTESLQLTGNGTQYSDFTWEANLEQTWGAPNDGGSQTLPVVLSEFTAVFSGQRPTITWTTQSETNNSGWNLYRNQVEDFADAACINVELIAGAGTTSEPTNYSYSDLYPVTAGETYWYWLESVENNGTTETYGPITLDIPAGGDTPELPQLTSLKGNYPNPFNPQTTIQFTVKEGDTGTLTIYNAKGQTLQSVNVDANMQEYTWDAANYGSGIYFYKLETENFSQIKKMIMLK